MTTRKVNRSEELPRPTLVVPKQSALAKLTQRLELGQELQSRTFSNRAELEQARTDLREWHDYNKELLGVIFSNEKFTEEYSHKSHGPMVMASHIGQQVENYYNSVRAKLTSLSSINKRLDLILEEELTSAEADVKSPIVSPRHVNTHTTVNVSGGTMILGDGAQVNNVTVGDLITSLQEKIEELPSSEEKNKALGGISAILSNETFANITGAAVGSFLSHLLK